MASGSERPADDHQMDDRQIMKVPAAGRPAARARTGLQRRWVWLSLLPLGLGAWVPAYVGVVERRRGFTACGLLWAAAAIAGWVMASGKGGSDLAGALIIVAWVGAFATSLALRGVLKRGYGSGFDAAAAASRERLAERAQARQIAREQPALAREMGVGRPDLPGAQDAGLVDVNHAPAAVLASLPGVDDTLAAKLVARREQLHGWSSLEDLGSDMNLAGNLVEGLRDQAIFLAR